MRIFTNILLIAIFIVVVVIAIFNSEPVIFNYLAGTLQLPLIIFLLISFVFGILVGMVLMLGRTRRAKLKLKEKLAH